LEEFAGVFADVLGAVGHELEGFAAGVGFEVFVANFDSDVFEEEAAALGFFAHFLCHGIQRGEEDCWVGGVFLEGGFVPNRLHPRAFLDGTTVNAMSTQIHLGASDPKHLRQNRRIKPRQIPHRLHPQRLKLLLSLSPHPKQLPNGQGLQEFLGVLGFNEG
jgi:hypothetical protein